MTPKEINQLRRKCGLGRSAFARALGTTPTCVWKWEKGYVEPCGSSKKLLDYIDRGLLQLDPKEFRVALGRRKKSN
jgi:DNA-binding transcriptional regulator YiaG